MNPMDLRRGITLGVEAINAELAAMSIPVHGKEAIQNVATISANGDAKIGNILSDIFERLGQNGTVTVADGKTLETEVEYVEGIKWDRGYVSPYFVTDTKSSKTEFLNPLILLSDKKISNVQSILKFLEYASQNKRQLFIVAEDIDGEALATLVLNKLRGGLQVCAVKSPGFGDNRRNTMMDIATATGAVFISEDIGLTIDDADLDVLGTAEKIIISKDDTIIMGGAGDKAEITERVETIASSIETTTSEYDKEKL
jgi:chaperonin GroEL